MQEPSEEAGDSISMENVRDSPNLDRTLTERRKAEKRTLHWDLAVGELHLVSRAQESEDIQATKKPRLIEEPFSASTDEAATKISSHDTAVRFSTADSDHADADPVKGSRATGHWTLEEDAKLNSAVTSTCKKKNGKEYRTDWVTISLLVSGRTRSQCHNRWHQVLGPSIDRATNERSGRWTSVESSKLKDAVQTHGDKNWIATATLVPGRTKLQCYKRWKNVLDPNID
jgi:hypothetical protein